MVLASKYGTTTAHHRLIPVPAEERVHWRASPGEERPHPTARQYAVHRYGSRVGTLLKMWLPSPGPCIPGNWAWIVRDWENLENPDIEFDTLAQAKRALRVVRPTAEEVKP